MLAALIEQPGASWASMPNGLCLGSLGEPVRRVG